MIHGKIVIQKMGNLSVLIKFSYGEKELPSGLGGQFEAGSITG